MRQKFDIAVVGSGLGGLAAALVLAKDGFKVCVIEKNVQFGGNLQTFSRDKCIFDTGVHYLGGLSPGDNLFQLFDYLGIMKDLPLERMDDGFDRIIFDNDESFSLMQGLDNFINELSNKFPGDTAAIRRYVDDIQYVCSSFPNYSPGRVGSLREEVLGINAADYFEKLTGNLVLRAVLSGQSFLYGGLDAKTPFYVHCLCVSSYMRSAYKIPKGGSQITKLLVRELRRHGVQLFKRTEICSAEMIDGKLNCLKSVDNKTFYAEQFIFNIDLKLVLKIIGAQHFKTSFRNRISNLKTGRACFSVYMVLKPMVLPYFSHNIYHFQNPEAAMENQRGFYMLSATRSSEFPDYAESLTAIIYMDFDELTRWQSSFNTTEKSEFRGDDYEKFKAEKSAEVLAVVSKKFPEIPAAVEKIYSSSPLSYRDYIGTENGAMYAYRHDSGNPMATVFSPRTKIPNLFLTGQSVNMHGILGVTIGAFSCCSEILGKEYLQQKLRDHAK